jgi:hypothetical protein
MRAGLRMLGPLLLCASAAAAALAHYAIDVVGDYALRQDTYDAIEHGSRELVVGIALIVAVLLALKGVRTCCDVALANRGRLALPAVGRGQVFGFLAGSLAITVLLVPAMEVLDGRISGDPVSGIDDAFGGSLLLGLTVTAFCAVAVAAAVVSVAVWLVSHRDAIEAIVVSLLGRTRRALAPYVQDRRRGGVRPHRVRTVHALRLSKRGPPSVATHQRQHFPYNSEGDPRVFLFTRAASTVCTRDRVLLCGAGGRRP